MQKKSSQQKTVQIIARYEWHCDPRKVAYRVRSSDGTAEYTCYLFDGKATSCDCPARKPCYHMSQLEAHEAATRETHEARRAAREKRNQLRQEQAAFPYGILVPLWDEMSGVVVSDVFINPEGIHCADLLIENGEWVTFSISDLRWADDPWAGLDDTRKFEAWRNYETSMLGLAS